MHPLGLVLKQPEAAMLPASSLTMKNLQQIFLNGELGTSKHVTPHWTDGHMIEV
jgi:hypothetical protein